MLWIVTQFWIIAVHQRVLISLTQCMICGKCSFFSCLSEQSGLSRLFSYHCFFCETHDSTERFVKLNNWMFCPQNWDLWSNLRMNEDTAVESAERAEQKMGWCNELKPQPILVLAHFLVCLPTFLIPKRHAQRSVNPSLQALWTTLQRRFVTTIAILRDKSSPIVKNVPNSSMSQWQRWPIKSRKVGFTVHRDRTQTLKQCISEIVWGDIQVAKRFICIFLFFYDKDVKWPTVISVIYGIYMAIVQIAIVKLLF